MAQPICFKLMTNRYFTFFRSQLLSFASVTKFALQYAFARPAIVSGNTIAVLITPWFGTQAPWTSLAIGLLLHARCNSVTFVFEALDIGPQKSLPETIQLIFLRLSLFVLQCLNIHVRYVCKISSQWLSLKSDYSQDALNYATWLARGETNIAESTLRLLSHQFSVNASSIHNSCSGLKVGAFLIPGGICKNSSLWIQHCIRANTRYSTFDDGGVGKLMYSCHGIAAQNSDVPEFIDSIILASKLYPSLITKILSLSTDEITRRSNGLLGSDGTVSQSTIFSYSTGGPNPYALICLNSLWDSASLGLHSCFNNSLSWLRSTIEYILANSCLDIVVRQHPHEKYDFSRGSDDLLHFLTSWFDHSPRVIFEDCYSKANTYNILSGSAFVVAHTSTIGLESSFLGKPVITQSSSYYARSGAVFCAQDINDYFALIDKGVAGSLRVSSQMQEQAGLFFYASQKCSFIDTELAPSRSSLMQGINFSALLNEQACSRILKSIETGISFLKQSCLQELIEADDCPS